MPALNKSVKVFRTLGGFTFQSNIEPHWKRKCPTGNASTNGGCLMIKTKQFQKLRLLTLPHVHGFPLVLQIFFYGLIVANSISENTHTNHHNLSSKIIPEKMSHFTPKQMLDHKENHLPTSKHYIFFHAF